jgi:hypothetical protein
MIENMIAFAAGIVQNSTGKYIQIPEGITIQGVVTDPFTWTWLTLMSIVGPILGFAFIGMLSWHLYDQKVRTPVESQIVKECSLKKYPLEILEGDSGYIEFKAGVRMGPQGEISTKKEGRNQTEWTGFLPRPTSNHKSLVAPPDADEDVKKEVAATNELATQLSNATIERRILRGAKVPVSLGYKGKAILTNIKSIAILKTISTLIKIEEDAAIYINMGALKALFGENWNTAQISALKVDRETIGYLRARKLGGKESWMMALIAIGIFFGGLAALVAVVAFLK